MRPLPVKLSKRAEFDFRSKLFGSEPDSRHAKIAPDFTPGDNDFKHFQFERRVERFFSDGLHNPAQLVLIRYY